MTLLDPEMIGLRSPKTDLDSLLDFSECAFSFTLIYFILFLFVGRSTLRSNQDIEFVVQDNRVAKLEHFMKYLVMVKYLSAWRPH